MEPDSPFNYPRSSFQFPAPLPSVEPDASPLETIQVNTTWLEYLRGCAKQLLLETTWDTDDPSALNLVQQRAMNLIGLLQDKPMATGFVGQIVMSGSSTAPDETWLPCDGASYLRADYPDLFDYIGTIWGSADGTHFNVPDMRSQSPMGVGQHPGLTDRTLASHFGEEGHQLTAGENGNHTHTIFSGNKYTAFIPGTTGAAMDGNGTVAQLNTGPGGNGTAHNTIHPVVIVAFFIKAVV